MLKVVAKSEVLQLKVGQNLSYEQMQKLKDEKIWCDLSRMTVGEAIEAWLYTLKRLTAKNYRSGMNFLTAQQIINPATTLQVFALVNQNTVIDKIKSLDCISECSKQARAACFIAFTRFLSRHTDGMIKRAVPCKEGTAKTFFRVREKVKTNAMTHKEWSLFLRELGATNMRDCLIAKLILQGGKRISEVLSLTRDQIDFDAREITFKQSKTRGCQKETVITYPQSIMDELKDYLGERRGHVFITYRGNAVVQTQLAYTFSLAGNRAKISFKVTPHVLRATTVTYLKREGFGDSDIMKVTGHSSAEMVHAYDKSERSNNPTKVISLI